MFINNMTSSTSSSPPSNNNTLSNIAFLPPPPPPPWTSTARRLLYKHSPPPHLINSSLGLEDALVKKRPGRPCIQDATPFKRRAVDPSSYSDLDMARLRRVMSNRMSAQKSRLRKEEYVESLKKAVATEEGKVTELTPKLKDYECLNRFLRKENDKLRESLASLETVKAAKEAEYVEMKRQMHDLVCQFDAAANLRSRY